MCKSKRKTYIWNHKINFQETRTIAEIEHRNHQPQTSINPSKRDIAKHLCVVAIFNILFAALMLKAITILYT